MLQLGRVEKMSGWRGARRRTYDAPGAPPADEHPITDPGVTRGRTHDGDHRGDAARGFARIEVPGGTYLIGLPGNDIYTAGLNLPDGIEFVLDPDTVLQMKTHDKWNSCLLRIDRGRDVVVRGGTLRGDRDTHVFTPRADGGTAHDEGHLLCIENSARVLVENVRLTAATGDGILVVGSDPPQDITIRHDEFDRNRRQGVSIVGGLRVAIEDNEIHHTSGIAPAFGIDIESKSYESRDIAIRRNDFHHNQGGDIVSVDGKNVLIDANSMDDSGLATRQWDGPIVFRPTSDLTIRNNRIKVRIGSSNGKVGIIGYSKKAGGTFTDRPNPALNHITDNVCDGCGMYIYNTDGFRISGNEFIQGYIVVTDVRDVVLEDNEVSCDHDAVDPTCAGDGARWGWRLVHIVGSASGNTFEGRPFPIPMQPGVPYTHDHG